MSDTQQIQPTQDPVRAAARKRIEKRRNLQGGLVAYVVVNAFLVAVWAMTGGGYFWPAWIIAGWGVGMLLGLWDYLRGPVTEADIDDELRREVMTLPATRRRESGGVKVLFVDRTDAGRRLARKLGHLRGADVVVVGLPRGGVPVAFEVAKALEAPLDVILVRKVGVPFQPELGMGAIGEDGVRVVNSEMVLAARVSASEFAEVERRERAELARRAERFRRGRPRVSLEGRTVVVVDDGIATGSTARAACQVARAHGAARVVLAVPVAPPGWTVDLAGAADELVCAATPEPFLGIGMWYRDFTQTTDDEVVACLDRAVATPAAAPLAADNPPVFDGDVDVAAGPVHVHGHLTVPEAARGIIVFAHGSGSSRHSPRNRYVASVLNGAGLGTLLVDLLTPDEESDRTKVFDIEMLAGRLTAVTKWLRARPEASALPVAYFGASTGAGAALWAAAERDADIAAVVSRGGRPDLAARRLDQVRAPTLLIVGGDDEVVLDLNRRAQAVLRCDCRLVVVPGATHLFEEPGALEAVAGLARDWFVAHFSSVQSRTVQR